MVRCAALSAACGVALAAAIAQAQQIIQQDVNDLPFQVKDATGNDAPFQGVNHTGSVVFGLDEFTVFNGVFIQASPNGPFEGADEFVGALTDASITIVLDNGIVVDGSLQLIIDDGADTFSAELVGGQVFTSVLGFTIDLITAANQFSDLNYGGVSVAPWAGLNDGSALVFKLDPTDAGFGYADIDIFTVPAPATGLGLGALGLVALTRRRR